MVKVISGNEDETKKLIRKLQTSWSRGYVYAAQKIKARSSSPMGARLPSSTGSNCLDRVGNAQAAFE